MIGMRLDGRHELTVAVRIDHNMWSSIADAGALPDPIDQALTQLAESSSDTNAYKMSLADARAWIEDALNKSTLALKTETWPRYRALVQWLVDRLPVGGEHRSPAGEWESNEQLCDRFFATSSAAPFTDSSHRALLLELFDSVRVTHCGGARHASNVSSAARPTSMTTFRWRSHWTLPIYSARSFHTPTRRAGFETN